jgi:amicyanin
MAVALALVSATASGEAPPVAIAIDNFAFSMPQLTIAAGTTVTWTNKDDEPHTIRAQGANPAFHSPALDKGDSYSFVFKDPGTYAYYCTIHPHMVGTIVVQGTAAH